MLSRPLVAMTAIVVLATVLYIPSINGEFIFDDVLNIVNNPIIKNLNYYTDMSKASELERYDTFRRRPLGYLTLTANYLAEGLDTTGYHVINVLIHAANALLLYALVLLLFKTPFLQNSNLAGRSPTIAFLAAIIFAIHPVQTQGVSYIIQRLASLATMFYLASMVCYLASRLSESRNRKILFYVVSLAAAVLGMKTKEIAFTLPLCVLMFELFFFTGSLKRRLAWWAPMGLTMLIIPLTVLSLRGFSIFDIHRMQKSLRVQTMPRSDYLLTESRVIITYLRLIVLPFNQTLDYSYPMYRSFRIPGVWASFVFLCSIAGAGIYLFRKSRTGNPALRVVALAVAWFFLTLSVESTLVMLFPIYEHRLYLPMAGVSIGASTGALILYNSLKHPRARHAATAFAIVLLLVLAVATFKRNFVWQTKISMWEDVINNPPLKSRAHMNLGKAYRDAGMEEKAMEQFNASLQAKTFEDYLIRIKSLINMGQHYLKQGDDTRAIELYKSSIKIDPEYEMGYYNLAVVYLNQGKADEALAELETAIEKNPGYALSYFLKGEALMKLHRPSGAAKSYRKALEIDSKLGMARTGLARALDAMGQPGQALTQYRQAAAEIPDDADVQYMLGNALKEAGNLDGAANAWTRAVKLNPEHAGALNNLGDYYFLKGDYSKAVQYIEESLKYYEPNPEAHYDLAMALENLGRTDEAVSHYKRFIELAPPEYASVVARVKKKLGELK